MGCLAFIGSEWLAHLSKWTIIGWTWGRLVEWLNKQELILHTTRYWYVMKSVTQKYLRSQPPWKSPNLDVADISHLLMDICVCSCAWQVQKGTKTIIQQWVEALSDIVKYDHHCHSCYHCYHNWLHEESTFYCKSNTRTNTYTQNRLLLWRVQYLVKLEAEIDQQLIKIYNSK